MRRPEVKTWGGVVTAAMVVALAVYMGTGERSPLRARLRGLPLSVFVPSPLAQDFLGLTLHSQHVRYFCWHWLELGVPWASSCPNERCVPAFIQQLSVGT